MPYSGENMGVADSNLFENTHMLFSNRLLKILFYALPYFLGAGYILNIKI